MKKVKSKSVYPFPCEKQTKSHPNLHQSRFFSSCHFLSKLEHTVAVSSTPGTALNCCLDIHIKAAAMKGKLSTSIWWAVAVKRSLPHQDYIDHH